MQAFVLKPAEDRLGCKSKYIHTITGGLYHRKIKIAIGFSKFIDFLSNGAKDSLPERRNGK